MNIYILNYIYHFSNIVNKRDRFVFAFVIVYGQSDLGRSLSKATAVDNCCGYIALHPMSGSQLELNF